MSHDLGNYVEVHDRIEAFYEKYPDGSLQSKWDLLEIGGAPVIVVEAKAYRTADDQRPGIGLASEPVPGRTNFTKDSELMNAETSAWGRALAALGFKVKAGIATGNEVRARQGDGAKPSKPSAKQLEFLERLLKERRVEQPEVGTILEYAAENLTGGKGGSFSKVLDLLKDNQSQKLEGLRDAAKAWAASKSDIPADTEGMDLDPGEPVF